MSFILKDEKEENNVILDLLKIINYSYKNNLLFSKKVNLLKNHVGNIVKNNFMKIYKINNVDNKFI
jgi:phage-related tail protein